MPAGPDFMRPLRLGEEGAAEALLVAAFPGRGEADLVRSLRARGEMVAEWVLPWQDGIAGYLALSRMVGPAGWLALAPVAVAPDWQGKGWGRRLVSGVMRLMAIKGETTVVLGNPDFYGRCGFDHRRAAQLTGPYPVKFLSLARPGTDTPAETLVYSPAFDGV
jgi:putative acetyltransferase